MQKALPLYCQKLSLSSELLTVEKQSKVEGNPALKMKFVQLLSSLPKYTDVSRKFLCQETAIIVCFHEFFHGCNRSAGKFPHDVCSLAHAGCNAAMIAKVNFTSRLRRIYSVKSIICPVGSGARQIKSRFSPKAFSKRAVTCVD